MRKEAALMPVIGCDTHGFMRMKVGSLVKYTVRVGGEPGFVFGVVKEVHSERKGGRGLHDYRTKSRLVDEILQRRPCQREPRFEALSPWGL